MIDNATGLIRLTWNQARAALAIHALEYDSSNSGPLYNPLENEELTPEEVEELLNRLQRGVGELQAMLTQWRQSAKKHGEKRR